MPSDSAEGADSAADPAADASVRRQTTFLASVFGALVVIGWVGDASAPTLATSAPLLLVALSSKGRNVLLASRRVSWLPLATVVIVRRLIAVPVCHRLGKLRGPAILDWVDRKYPTMGESTRMIEGWFGKQKVLAVTAIPGNLTSMLAGVAEMPMALVLVLSAVGFAIRVAFTLALGEALGSPLDGLLDFFSRNRVPVLIVTVALIAFQLVRGKISQKPTNEQEPPPGDVEVPPRLGEE